MQRSSAGHAKWWMLAAVVSAAACTRGPLPDLGFGSVDATGDTAATTLGTSVGDDASGDAEVGPTTMSSSSSTSAGSSDDAGDGDGDSSSSSSSSDDGPSTTTNSTGDGDPSTGPDGDGDGDDWGGDTWGIPPDVTNEPCDPLAQACFPTHKCVPYATQPNGSFWDANKCVPILGDKAWGEACTLDSPQNAQDDCDGDGFCWKLQWFEGELHGTCVPFCVGPPQDLMCPVGWGCLFSGAIALCTKQCDPLIQDCPLDYGCYWAGNGFDCALTASEAGQGQACDDYNDCLPGVACVAKDLVPGCQGNDPNCCTQWCDLSEPDPCPDPLSCVSFFAPNEAPPMLADVGICIF
jgi:hypothetical protein